MAHEIREAREKLFAYSVCFVGLRSNVTLQNYFAKIFFKNCRKSAHDFSSAALL